MTIQEIEAVLAEMLETYARLREKYIHGDANDYHSLDHLDRSIADEAGGIRQAAHLIRSHRENYAGMGLPVYLWDEWAQAERAISARLEGVQP